MGHIITSSSRKTERVTEFSRGSGEGGEGSGRRGGKTSRGNL